MCFFDFCSAQGSSEKPHLDSSGSDSEPEGTKVAPYTTTVPVVPPTQLNPYPPLGASSIGQPLYQGAGGILHDYQTL